MAATNSLASLDLEKYIISGILNYPDVYFEISPFISEVDFSKKLHSVIWTGIKIASESQDKFDYRMLAFKIQELKIGFEEENNLSLLDYLEAIEGIKISSKATVFYAKKLKCLTVKREIIESAKNVARKLVSSGDLEYTEIIELAESTFYNQINLYENGANEPIDVFEDIERMIEEKGDDPKEQGIKCPYDCLRAAYGNFTAGDLFFFVARSKSGKSTLLMNMLYKVCCLNETQNVKGLYLDTELETERFQYRLISAITGIQEVIIRNGRWRLNKDTEKKMREAWPIIRAFKNKIDHIYIANKKAEEVVPLIRRWYRKNIEPKKESENLECLVVYDYIKLGDEFHNSNNNMRPDLVVGHKVDCFKKLASELQIPILTSAQTNRSNEGRTASADRRIDGSVVGLSDQINQFASNVYLYNRLVIEDLQKLHGEYGIRATHELIPIYTRSQGESAPGIFDLVKLPDGKWVDNLLYFNVDNFNVTEVGDLRSIVKKYKNIQLDGAEQDNSDVEI